MAVVEDAPASAGRTAAALATVLAVVAVILLPVAIASGAAGGVARPRIAWLGGLAAVVGGVKLAAAAWGLVERVRARPWLVPAPASID